MFLRIEDGLIAIQKQTLNDTPIDPLYIPAQGTRTTSCDEEPFDLHQAIQKILEFEKKNTESKGDFKESKEPTRTGEFRKVLLLLGDGGSGKSLFCQDLIVKLWKEWEIEKPVPIFISLPLIQSYLEEVLNETLGKNGFSEDKIAELRNNPLDHIVEIFFAEQGFTVTQIAELKKSQQFIFILDGYDEIHQFKNLYVSNQLNEWNAKVIITCRSQYLYNISDTDKYFMPYECERRQPWLLTQIYIAPFAEKQIEAYIKQYSSQNAEWVKEHSDIFAVSKVEYKEKKGDSKTATKEVKDTKLISPIYQQLLSIPGLKELIATPFMLHLAVESLPNILAKHKEKKSDDDHRETQASLYDAFIEHWFVRQQEKLIKSGHIKPDDEDIKQKFWAYCKELAQLMREKELTYVTLAKSKSASLFAETKDKKPSNEWQRFFSTDPEVELLRSASPIRKFGKDQFGFIHASMIEYFATRALFDKLIAPPATYPISQQGDAKSTENADVDLMRRNGAERNEASEKALQNPICRSYFLKHNELRFNADRVTDPVVGKKIKAKYFEYIEASKTDERFAIAAANAISALNYAGVSFSEMNFNNIKIPKAKLEQATLDSTQLQNADLREVNFKNSWLSKADLSNAKMAGVYFGEFPVLQFEDIVMACCVSSDGRLLAVCCGDVIYVYEIQTNKKIKTMRPNVGEILCISFALKDQSLIFGSEKGIICVVKLETGDCRKTLNAHDDAIVGIVFDKKYEKHFVSKGRDNSIYLWNIETGEREKIFSKATAQLPPDLLNLMKAMGGALPGAQNVSFSETITALENPEPELEDFAAFIAKSMAKQSPHFITFDMDISGKYIASAGIVGDSIVRIWDTATGECKHKLKIKASASSAQTSQPSFSSPVSVCGLAFSPTGEYLATAESSGAVYLWEVETGECKKIIKTTQQGISCITFCNDHEHLAIGSGHGSIYLWNLAAEKCEQVFERHTSTVSMLIFDAASKCLISSGYDGTVCRHKVIFEDLELMSNRHTNGVQNVVFDKHAEYCASGSFDKTVRIWNVATGQCVRILKQEGMVDGVAYNVTGECLAVRTMTKGINLWDLKMNTYKHEFSEYKGICCFAFDKQNKNFVCGGVNSNYLVNLTTEEHKQILITKLTEQKSQPFDFRHMIMPKGVINSIVFNTQGNLIAAGNDFGQVRLWNILENKEELGLKGHSDIVRGLAFDAKDRYLASASEDKNVCLWEMSTKKRKHLLVGHTGPVTSVAFNTQGNYLMSGSGDSTVRLWDTQAGKCLLTVRAANGWINSIDWRQTSAGSFLVVGSHDKAVRLYQIAADEKIQPKAILCWSSHHVLTAVDCCIAGVSDLSESNFHLLKQRNAKDGSINSKTVGQSAHSGILSPAEMLNRRHEERRQLILAAGRGGMTDAPIDRQERKELAVAEIQEQHFTTERKTSETKSAGRVVSIPIADIPGGSEFLRQFGLFADADQNRHEGIRTRLIPAEEMRDDETPCCCVLM